MIGFCGVLTAEDPQAPVAKRLPVRDFDTPTRIDTIEGIPGLFLIRRTLDRFMDDKLFHSRADRVYVLEGVILNKRELIARFGMEDWAATVASMHESLGETFFAEFRGTFSGAVYDAGDRSLLLYASQIGDKQLFYHLGSGVLLFGSSPSWIRDQLSVRNVQVGLNEDAAVRFLHYGYLIEDDTLFTGIKRLTAGRYLVYRDGETSEHVYFDPSPTEGVRISRSDAIDGIDTLFRAAVERDYSKDVEYGYRHLATLSGGLDSRMNVWVAHDLGYTKQLNICFAQSDSDDERISKQVACSLGHEYMLKTLDGGGFLVPLLRPVTRMTHGSVFYLGVAHGVSLESLLDMRQFGLVHTGQIGDVIVSSFLRKPRRMPPDPYHGFPSSPSYLVPRSLVSPPKRSYPNHEALCLQQRAFTGALSGNLGCQEFSEPISPFLDMDFYQFCMALPLEYRVGHSIYKDWVRQRYPAAGRFVWQKTGRPPNGPSLLSKCLGLPRRVAGKLLSLVRVRSVRRGTYNGMNPVDRWYDENAELRRHWQRCLAEGVGALRDSGHRQIADLCESIYGQGTALDRVVVVSLLDAFDAFFAGK
jgi:asparagine synthase (glutamine-hydrolysing)